MAVVARGEEVQLRIGELGLDPQKIAEGMREEIVHDGELLGLLQLRVEVWILSLQRGGEIDEEGDRYPRRMKSMTTKMGLRWIVKEDLSVVCKVDDKSVLLAVLAYDLRDDVVIVVDTIDIVRKASKFLATK